MSSVIDPIGEAIERVLRELDAAELEVKSEWLAPKQLSGSGPWAVVDLPRFRRTPPDEPEDELGSSTWRLWYPTTIYVDLKEAKRDQGRALEIVEAFIHAVDLDRSLGDTVFDSSVVEGEPEIVGREQARPLLAYECQVEVLQLVGNP